MRGGDRLAIGLALLARLTAAEQEGAFCHLTQVETQVLSNAVRVSIESDGLLRVFPDYGTFFDFETFSPRATRRLVFYLLNAKSQVGNFAEVGYYPISHLEIRNLTPAALPSYFGPVNLPAGVGVLLEVVLYTPARLRSMEFEGDRIEPDELGGQSVGEVTFDARLSENKSSLVVTVISDRPVEQVIPKSLEERLKDRARALEVVGERGKVSVYLPEPAWDRLWNRRQALQVTGEPGRGSVYALNADIHTLFDALAEVSQTPIVVDEKVQHLVSAYLPNLPIDEMVHRLAAAYGLSVRKVGKAYLIGETLERELVAYNLGATERLPLRFLSPEQALLLLPNFLLRYVHPDAEHNALMVTGPPEMVEKLRRDLARIDLPAPQVQVEAVAVQANDSTELLRALNLASADEAQPWAWSVRPIDGFLHYLDRADLPEDFTAQLEAWEKNRQVKLRSRAQATVVNGQTARLFLGRQQFIQILRGGDTLEVDLEQVEEGLTLEVTPWASAGGWVQARLRPELSNIVEVEPTTGMPTLSTRRAEANLLIRSGETIILGGQVMEQRTVTKRRIPLLADLPLVGALFRTRQVQSQKSDLVLFVTLQVKPT